MSKNLMENDMTIGNCIKENIREKLRATLFPVALTDQKPKPCATLK